MSKKYNERIPNEFLNSSVVPNANGVSVASDGSGFVDCSLVPSNSVTEAYLVPGTELMNAASDTEMTGAVPTTSPLTNGPSGADYEALGMSEPKQQSEQF